MTQGFFYKNFGHIWDARFVYKNPGLISDKRFVHKYEKEFECSQCKSRFISKTKMNIHVDSVHKKVKVVKVYQCFTCENEFSLKSTLKRHIQNVHSKGKIEQRLEEDESDKHL